MTDTPEYVGGPRDGKPATQRGRLPNAVSFPTDDTLRQWPDDVEVPDGARVTRHEYRRGGDGHLHYCGESELIVGAPHELLRRPDAPA